MRIFLAAIVVPFVMLISVAGLRAHPGHEHEHHHAPVETAMEAAPSPSAVPFSAFLVVLAGAAFLAVAVVAAAPKHTKYLPLSVFSVLIVVLVLLPTGCGDSKEKQASDDRPQPRHDIKELEKLYEHFKKDNVTFRTDDDYFYIESNAFPNRSMMVGITAWQQQVPLPQPYAGKNAWRIPLKPAVAAKPISAKKALYRGAIALAVDGVPIFNALNNRGEDAYLAGELDEYGGHCGRGDDYHYHIAPVHLEKVVGKGKPIAYALDGFPLYGYTDADGKEPKDLDEFNGRFEKDGSYRYYSTKKYPYINGGMRGAVAVRGDQLLPTAKAGGFPGQALRHAAPWR